MVNRETFTASPFHRSPFITYLLLIADVSGVIVRRRTLEILGYVYLSRTWATAFFSVTPALGAAWRGP